MDAVIDRACRDAKTLGEAGFDAVTVMDHFYQLAGLGDQLALIKRGKSGGRWFRGVDDLAGTLANLLLHSLVPLRSCLRVVPTLKIVWPEFAIRVDHQVIVIH